MDGLDFSELTDDQLVELARACCVEAIRRSPATHHAMQDMMLTEAEKIRVARAATESEIAAGRARERERIASAAAAQARMDEEARTAAARAEAAVAQAERAMQAAQAADHRNMALLRQAAALVGRTPASISLLYCDTKRGRRVYINPGAYRYTIEHLVTYSPADASISATAALIKQKPDLIRFCASLVALLPLNTYVAGKNFQWPEE